MYVPEPTNIPIEKTNHREIDMEVPLWPTPSENDIIHLPRGECQSQHDSLWALKLHPARGDDPRSHVYYLLFFFFFNFQNFF